MEIRFVPVEFSALRDEVVEHLLGLPSRIDSFLEDRILESNHYRITLDAEPAGFTSIRERGLITQFALATSHMAQGQRVFRQVRRLEEARGALVPTCDEFFLAYALDDYRDLRKQAYFFQLGRPARAAEVARRYTLRRAQSEHAEFILEEAGELFDPLEPRLERGEIYLVEAGDEIVGFGIMERSKFYPDTASIGMHTIEAHRRRGVGAATIALLIEACGREKLVPVAGCWYYNHASKRTLERAGMVTPTRLLNIGY